jgi:hypothetical protein
MTYVPTGAPYPVSVAKTFDLAIEKATAASGAAERLLGVFSFFAPDGIPLDLVQRVISVQDEQSKAIVALKAVSLIEFFEGDSLRQIRLHRLVQAAMRSRLERRERGETAITMAVDCIIEAMRPWKSTMDAIIDPASKPYRNQIWALLPYTGDIARAEPLWRHATETAFLLEPLHQKGVPLSARYREYLADVQGEAGRREEAKQAYLSCIAQIETALGEENIEIARLHNKIGLLWLKSASGYQRSKLVRAIDGFGLQFLRTLLQNQDHSSAAREFRKAIAIAERVGEPNAPEISIYRDNLHYAESPTFRSIQAFKETVWPSFSSPKMEKIAIESAMYLVGASSLITLSNVVTGISGKKGVWFKGFEHYLPSSVQVGLELLLAILGAWLAFRLWKKQVSVVTAWAAFIYFLMIYVIGQLILGSHSTFFLAFDASLSILGTVGMIGLLRVAHAKQKRKGVSIRKA